LRNCAEWQESPSLVRPATTHRPRLDNPYRLVAEVMLFQYLPVELCGSVVSFYEYICHNEKSILLHPWTFWLRLERSQKKEDTILKRQFSHLHFINDVLHRQVTNNDKVQQQIVLLSERVVIRQDCKLLSI
jgi:hypothetical protein